MNETSFTIRNAMPDEFAEIGQLMTRVYSQLDGFPKEDAQPSYYAMLANIGELTKKPGTDLLVAASPNKKIAGAVVYFDDMVQYGATEKVTAEKNSAGFRLLAVDKSARGHGIGRMLTAECIRKAREKGRAQVIIHSTEPMWVARKMYEDMGFKRAEDFDFFQGEFPIMGFRLKL